MFTNILPWIQSSHVGLICKWEPGGLANRRYKFLEAFIHSYRRLRSGVDIDRNPHGHRTGDNLTRLSLISTSTATIIQPFDVHQSTE